MSNVWNHRNNIGLKYKKSPDVPLLKKTQLLSKFHKFYSFNILNLRYFTTEKNKYIHNRKQLFGLKYMQ